MNELNESDPGQWAHLVFSMEIQGNIYENEKSKEQ